MNVRIKRLQALDQHLMGGQISGSHRRVVSLGGHGDIGAPEGQDHFARQSREFNHRGEQRMWQVVQRIGHG